MTETSHPWIPITWLEICLRSRPHRAAPEGHMVRIPGHTAPLAWLTAASLIVAPAHSRDQLSQNQTLTWTVVLTTEPHRGVGKEGVGVPH